MPDKATWKEQMDLAADTVQVTFYPKERHKQEWKEAAQRAGYSSLSSYLYDLVLEGRAYRQEGFLSHQNSQNRIEQLEAEGEALEAELKRERLKHPGRRAVDDTAFLRQFLTAEYQTLDGIIDSGALEWIIDDRVEAKTEFSHGPRPRGVRIGAGLEAGGVVICSAVVICECAG